MRMASMMTGTAMATRTHSAMQYFFLRDDPRSTAACKSMKYSITYGEHLSL